MKQCVFCNENLVPGEIIVDPSRFYLMTGTYNGVYLDNIQPQTLNFAQPLPTKQMLHRACLLSRLAGLTLIETGRSDPNLFGS